jgi:hypothetical protein
MSGSVPRHAADKHRALGKNRQVGVIEYWIACVPGEPERTGGSYGKEANLAWLVDIT